MLVPRSIEGKSPSEGRKKQTPTRFQRSNEAVAAGQRWPAGRREATKNGFGFGGFGGFGRQTWDIYIYIYIYYQVLLLLFLLLLLLLLHDLTMTSP